MLGGLILQGKLSAVDGDQLGNALLIQPRVKAICPARSAIKALDNYKSCCSRGSSCGFMLPWSQKE